MRRNFRTMPGDQIEDEDERCRVLNREFVERRKRQRERGQKMAFGILAAFGIILAIAFVYLMSHPR